MLTKDERYENYRLAKRARGLYKAEKQALIFIGDAQTMQDGVCRKALTSAADLGFGARQVRFGLHGRRRNGKTEFPGLIARGIVSVVCNESGGRAPGGQGLPAVYAINREVLLTYVPEIDYFPEKDEPKTEPSSNNDEPLGEPKEELMPARSYSSYSSFNNCPSVEPKGEKSEGHVVDDGEMLSQSPAAPADDRVLPPSACASGRTPSSEEEKTNTNPSDRENQPPSESPDLEARIEQAISLGRQRQLDRNASDREIFQEYKAVFDRLRRDYKAKDDFEPKMFDDPNDPRAAGLLFKGGTRKYANNPVWVAMPEGCHFENDLRTTADHRRAAADLYRSIGRDEALAKWEHFLVNDDHTATQRVVEIGEDAVPTGKVVSIEVERTWLLHDFVLAFGVSPSNPPSAPESVVPEKKSRSPQRFDR